MYESATAASYRQNSPPANSSISSSTVRITVHTSSYAINPLGRGLQSSHNSTSGYKMWDSLPIRMADFVFLIVFHVIHNPKSYQQQLKEY